MTAAGWLFLGASWILILAVLAFCLWRVFQTRDEEKREG